MSNKLIRDCSECQKEIQVQLKNAYDWEVKKKEVLENKIQNEPCLKDIDFNLGHRGSIEKALEKYRIEKSNSHGVRMSVFPACNKCGATWQDNEYGDETGDKSLKDDNHACQQQSHSSHSTQNKSISNNNSQIQEREREREQWQLQI